MPWITPDDPFARGPRFAALDTERLLASDVVVRDGEIGSIDGQIVDGAEIDVDELEVLEITESRLVNCRFHGASPRVELRFRGSEVLRSDLGATAITSLRSTVLEGCKLAGTIVTGQVVDVELRSCSVRLARFTGSTWRRVAIVDSVLDDTEIFDCDLEDVTLDGTTCNGVRLDRSRFDRVDLRGATQLDLHGFESLRGCLIAPEQVLEMATLLAHHVGIGIDDSALP